MDIRREELPVALLMFGYFFLVISTFWILKPIKKPLFIGFYDQTGFQLGSWVLRAAQAELLAKVLNMVVAAVAVVVFTWLSRRLVRQQLTLAFTVLFVGGFAAYAVLLGDPGAVSVWSFYLYGDLYSTVMVATFFAFLNDAIAPQAARRLYGPILLGGVSGGVFGSAVLRLWVDSLSSQAWMGVCIVVAGLIALLAWVAGRHVDASRDDDDGPSKADEAEPAAPRQNPAIEGAALVFRSRYLLSVAVMVGLYEIVSTVMDYQFSATVSYYLDGAAIGQQFATVYLITNIASLVVQVFLTGALMSRFRLTVPLMVLPVAVAVASGMFLMVPALWIGSALSTADNAFSYSLNQSTKEALYTPTTRDEKYKAKAFIDMFVQRFAKAVAVGVSLLVTMIFADFSTVRWLSVFTIAIVILWAIAARYAGRRFHELSDG